MYDSVVRRSWLGPTWFGRVHVQQLSHTAFVTAVLSSPSVSMPAVVAVPLLQLSGISCWVAHTREMHYPAPTAAADAAAAARVA
jgi:hypothetical protein